MCLQMFRPALSLMACFLLLEELAGAILVGTVGLWGVRRGDLCGLGGSGENENAGCCALRIGIRAGHSAHMSLDRLVLGVGAGVAVQGLTAGITTQ